MSNHNRVQRFKSRASMRTKAVIASTTGTARIATHGSCLEPAGNSRVTTSPWVVSVSCGFLILDAGLKATLPVTGSPVEIPPSVPPARFVLVMNDRYEQNPSSQRTQNHSPFSKPLVAGIDKKALAKWALSFHRRGLPNRWVLQKRTNSTTPPRESPSSCTRSSSATI